MTIIFILLQAIAAFFIGTLLHDILHYLFHVFLKSNNKLLRRIGHWHGAHHRFFSTNLKIQTQWEWENLIKHVVFEYITQVIGSLLCLLFFPLTAILLAITLESIIFVVVCFSRGQDLHHYTREQLPGHRNSLFVTSTYHALHHVYLNNFYSSYIKIVDYVLGSAMQLKGKHIMLTGASGALGSHMKLLLEKEGAIVTGVKYGADYDYDHYEKLKPILEKTDILFLCHGSKYDYAQQANCDSFVSMIEMFKSVRKRGLVPLEIWAVGSEIECHPCFGIKKLKVYAQSKRNFAKYAHQYYQDTNIQYRHIVHSAFTSRMGPGLMSAKFAALLTLFFLKRDFKYIPVSYTGFAFLNYLRFYFAPKIKAN